MRPQKPEYFLPTRLAGWTTLLTSGKEYKVLERNEAHAKVSLSGPTKGPKYLVANLYLWNDYFTQNEVILLLKPEIARCYSAPACTNQRAPLAKFLHSSSDLSRAPSWEDATRRPPRETPILTDGPCSYVQR